MQCRVFRGLIAGIISPVRIVLLTAATLVCFASNSLLTRGALGAGQIDWALFTLIRLVTGTITLAILVRARRTPSRAAGSWFAAVALAGYAVAFTFSYTLIGAAIGALLLFGAVQATMIGVGLIRGERPGRLDWIGVALAIGGLLVLTIPGVTAPQPLGAVLMIVAGVCWGWYSLAGRANHDPLAATAGNFLRATLLAAPVFVFTLQQRHATLSGLVLAAASGSVASGIGYTIWYTALPALAAWRAAIVQLAVPILTALLATVLLGETITTRLLAATVLIGGGICLTVWPGRSMK